MPLKKQTFGPDEIPIFDAAVVYRRGAYWQMRMWLPKEKKYARFSLHTRNKETAINKAQDQFILLRAKELNGTTYFSKTAKQGVEEYLAQRAKDVEAGLIGKGRFGTVKTHLEHWLTSIGRDTKLKALERTQCENYLHNRTKTKQKTKVSPTTVANEQSTINALIAWLHKRNETIIDAFDFPPIPRIDRGDEALRRSTFTEEEITVIKTTLEQQIAKAKSSIHDGDNFTKAVTGYYLLISIITGLRRGEQLQLRWKDIDPFEKSVQNEDKHKDKDKDKNKNEDTEKTQEKDEEQYEEQDDEQDDTYSLVKITVRAETSKVRRTRRFVVIDWEYFRELFDLSWQMHYADPQLKQDKQKFRERLIFSTNGTSPITPRAIQDNFDNLLKLAEIKQTQSRTLVPYSFRHYFITDMINNGATPTQVAETCGTSAVQIEKTYYHTTERKMIENALSNYYYRNGILVPKKAAS